MVKDERLTNTRGPGRDGSVMAGKDGVQRLDDLVLATVPAARPRRGETDRSKVAQREALRDDLVELANEIRQR